MFGFFKKHPKKAIALFDDALAKSRDPKLYADWQVPDTLDGRFDALLLHLWPIFSQLNDDKLAQQLYDVTFSRMEFALRETGSGDVSVAKQVRHMMKAFYGRLTTYAQANTDADWQSALRRNLYGTIKDDNFVVPDGIIAYVRALAPSKD